MKIKQIVCCNNTEIVALTETGELYCGFWVSKSTFDKPEFGWRKLPPIPKKAFQYSAMREPTVEELETARQSFESTKQ
jgi:hypothetical protein